MNKNSCEIYFTKPVNLYRYNHFFSYEKGWLPVENKKYLSRETSIKDDPDRWIEIYYNNEWINFQNYDFE
jgi:hypothetical protein